MGIPLLRGRDFNDGDLYDHPFVAIVSESLARQDFPNEDPIGHRIQCGLDSPNWMTIVGVVGDVRQYSPATQPGPEIYMALRQHPFTANEEEVVIRTAGDAEMLIPIVQKTIHNLDPGDLGALEKRPGFVFQKWTRPETEFETRFLARAKWVAVGNSECAIPSWLQDLCSDQPVAVKGAP
jgi:MacB-like periplasmic core domain